MDQIAIIAQRTQAVLACDLPATLHPLSANTLEAFLADNMVVEEFARFFSLADSSYIALTSCILAALENAPVIVAALP